MGLLIKAPLKKKNLSTVLQIIFFSGKKKFNPGTLLFLPQ